MRALAPGLSSSNVGRKSKGPPAPVAPTTRKVGLRMTSAPIRPFYPHSEECTLIVFDVRLPGAAEALHGQRAAWQEDSDLEALDKDHFVLVVRPGGARRLAR